MRSRWVDLDDRERAAFQTVSAFLLSRLEDRQSVDWALRLAPNDRVKRVAVLAVIDREAKRIAEPWRSAWRLIEEFWAAGIVNERDTTGTYAAKKRLQEGDRSGAMIVFITELVAPRLNLVAFSSSVKRPRSIHDLVSVRLTSGTCIDPRTLGIDVLTDQDFLASLGLALETAVSHGLECARRTGWDGQGLPLQIGSLYRAYHVSAGGEDPDKYRRGIAPSVKLLHEVVNRLATLQPALARQFAQRLKVLNSAIHLRLWAALARNAALVDADDVSQTLLTLDDERFWSVHYYPELTELRARRFSDLDAGSQASITKRIRKLPPRRLWRGKIPRDDLEKARLGRAIEELRRVQTAGGEMTQRDREWLASMKTAFPEIPEAITADYGFTLGARARWVSPNPDRSYDALSGEDRLRALESALSKPRHRWNDDPAERAIQWLRENNNALAVVTDLDSAPNAGATFLNLWKSLGIAHSHPLEQSKTERNLPAEAQRMFSLLARLPDDVAHRSIHGIAHWLAEWKSHFTPEMSDLWLRFWPMAMDATNAQEADDLTRRSGNLTQTEEHESRVEMDTLGTPAGQLVGVFLSACPDVRTGDRPFDATSLRGMRDVILRSTGRARLIALHGMIERLSYFLLADNDWAVEHLVETLNANNPQAIALWHAIARETRFHDVLKSVGEAMARRAADEKLSRETRQSLAFSVVVEGLHAFNEGRDPAVPDYRIQQMLRSVDDEVRVHAAYAVQRFIPEVSDDKTTTEGLFERAVSRFLHEVWPQERSLVTPGISEAFAKIPAGAVGVFPAAVSAIERFLVPFECWGMYEYGLDADEGDPSKLARIDNPEKAASLLRLLDLTIGALEGSTVPNDLSQALKRVREIAPKLVDDRVYRRLATSARGA